MRITYYQEAGWTYGGTWTTEHWTAACSWDIPLWSYVTIDGDEYQCQDRGDLGFSGWIDIYAPSGGDWVAQRYGDWALVEVVTN